MIKNIYSRRYPGGQKIGECEWCKRDIFRSDPFVVEEHNVIYKKLIHHGSNYKCFENYIKERKPEEQKEKPNALDEFWKHLGKG